MNKFLVIIERTEEGTGFGAYSPDLPGCYATGKTVEEVERRMTNAMQAHIQEFMRDGKPVPEPQTVGAHMVALVDIGHAGVGDAA